MQMQAVEWSLGALKSEDIQGLVPRAVAALPRHHQREPKDLEGEPATFRCWLPPAQAGCAMPKRPTVTTCCPTSALPKARRCATAPQSMPGTVNDLNAENHMKNPKVASNGIMNMAHTRLNLSLSLFWSICLNRKFCLHSAF